MNEQDPQYQQNEPRPVYDTSAPVEKKKTKKWPWIVGGLTALIVISSLAGGGDDTKAVADTPTPTVTETVTEEATPAPAEESQTEEAAPVAKPKPKPKPKPVAATYTMPGVVGENLQFAQDSVQAVTGNPLFYTESVDAKGLSRFQVIDSWWTVCGQKPAPSATFNDDTVVTFFVVKDTESC